MGQEIPQKYKYKYKHKHKYNYKYYLSIFAIRFQKFHLWSNMVIFLTWRLHFYLKYKEKRAALDLIAKNATRTPP